MVRVYSMYGALPLLANQQSVRKLNNLWSSMELDGAGEFVKPTIKKVEVHVI